MRAEESPAVHVGSVAGVDVYARRSAIAWYVSLATVCAVCSRRGGMSPVGALALGIGADLIHLLVLAVHHAGHALAAHAVGRPLAAVRLWGPLAGDQYPPTEP